MLKTKKAAMSKINKKLIVPEYWYDLVEVERNPSDCICRGDQDYCRCRTLSPTVISVDQGNILQVVAKNHELTPIQLYCLERWIRLCISIETIEACGVRGYYGEELEVSLCDSTKKLFQEYLDNLSQYTPAQNIEHVLELEYANIPDIIKNKEWILKTVDISTIEGGAKMIRKYVNSYNGTETILCRTIDKDHYRIIDGNHRFSAAKLSGQTKISIITTAE
jgi:hypothetical protein